MNRFQITAEIATTVWLGVLEDFQYAPMDIGYEKLKEFFELGGIYIPSHNELENQLVALSHDIRKEFMHYLCIIADEQVFRIDAVAVYLPLDNNAFIATHGTASSFVDGEFEAIVETNVSEEDVRDIVGDALDRAVDAVYQSSDYLSVCDAVYLDIQEIGN